MATLLIFGNGSRVTSMPGDLREPWWGFWVAE